MVTKEFDGQMRTNDGRVLLIVRKENTLEEAITKVYANISKIKCTVQTLESNHYEVDLWIKY